MGRWQEVYQHAQANRQKDRETALSANRKSSSLFLDMDMSEFAAMNEVYARSFGKNRPARTTVQVTSLPTPGLRVEVNAVAYIP